MTEEGDLIESQGGQIMFLISQICDDVELTEVQVNQYFIAISRPGSNAS